MADLLFWWLVACGCGAVWLNVGMGVAAVRARRAVRGLDDLGPPPLPAWRRAWWRFGRACPWAEAPLMTAFLAAVGLCAYGAKRGWVPRPPGGGEWIAHVLIWAAGLLVFWAVAETRRVCRDRRHVRALGPPILAAGHLDGEFRHVAATIAPPVLTQPGERRSRASQLILGAVAGLLLPACLLFGPVSPPPSLRLVLLAQSAAMGWLFLVVAVGTWWGVPRGRERWLTAEGAVARHLAVRWADAARVAVAAVPSDAPAFLPPGSVALEVCDGDRAERFLAGPGVRAELEALLAAVPPDRLVGAPAGGVPGRVRPA